MKNDINEEESKKICFVTVGDPKRQGKAYYEKVLVPLLKNEDIKTAAERFRVRVANGINRTRSDTPLYLPSDLYYLVFTNYADKLPILASENAKKKVLVLRVKNEYTISH